MAGLLQQGMEPQGQPSPQAQPGRPQQPSPQQGQSGPDVDPRQGKQLVNQLANAMLNQLYGPMLDQVRQVLGHGQQPEQSMGRVVAMLMTTIYQKVTENGRTIPPSVMFQVGMIVVQAVGEMAQRMQMLGERDGERIEAAFMLAMGEFGKATAESMKPEQRQRYAQMIEALRQGKRQAQGGQPQGGQQPPQGRPQRPQPQPNAAMAGGA